MARPKQEEMPIEGEGVSQVKSKALDALGDKFIEIRDAKATLATELGDVEKRMAEKMAELGILKYKFGDQVAEIKQGKIHVKIKTVKVEGGEPEE